MYYSRLHMTSSTLLYSTHDTKCSSTHLPVVKIGTTIPLILLPNKVHGTLLSVSRGIISFPLREMRKVSNSEENQNMHFIAH